MRVTWIVRLALALMLAVLCVCFPDVACAADSARVEELKAAYLFNFAKLVEWPPPTAAEALTICFMGASGVHDAFARAAGEKHVSGRSIVVKPVTTPETRLGCHVLYIDAAVAERVQRAEAALPGALTVSDAQDFAARGGMIELFSEGNRLRFNINLPSAQRAGLRISSSLLQLAAHIEKGSLQ